MQTFALLSTILAAASLGSAASCNADNCARYVTGTREGLPATRLAECSSFLQRTVAPLVTSTITVTPVVTATTTSTVTAYANTTVTTTYPGNGTVSVTRPAVTPDSVPAQIGKRFTTELPAPVTVTATSTITTTNSVCVTGSPSPHITTSPLPPVTTTTTIISPTTVPIDVAPACSDVSRYVSACSCAGVTAATVTQSVPITAFTTVTATGVSTVAAATVTTTATRTVYTGIPPVVTGLPCDSLITSSFGYHDSFRVRCDTSFHLRGYLIDVVNGLSEKQCLDKCAQTSNCGIATWAVARSPVCSLYFGDSANPRPFPANGTDLIFLEKRGTGPGGVNNTVIPLTSSVTSTLA